jgi:signal transduction histidine kinase
MQDPNKKDTSLLSHLGRWTRKQFTRESDDPDRLHRLRVLFAFGGTTFVLSLAWSVLHFLDGSRLVGSILLSDSVLILGLFAKLRYDKKLTAASHGLMIIATATTVLVTLYTGGLRLTNVAVFFMPLVASIFLLGRAGIVYAVLNVLAPLGFQVAQWTGHTFTDNVPPEGREMDAFLTWLVSMFVVLLFVLSYERARILSIRKLEQANRTKTQFLANMSHEIRTPLHVIMGLNTMLEKSGLDSDQREYVRTCQQNSEALLALLNDVLDLSKIEHGGFTLNDADFDPVEVTGSVSEILRYRCKDKGLDLAFDADPTVPRGVRGDHQRLRQVLMNLGGNAVKYTDEGSVRLSVQPADGTEEPHRLRFVVRDTGVGIDEQDRERVFQSFTQVDGSLARRHEGAGLGLFISSEIVRLMGGDIRLESTPGKGSTFSVEIPFQPPANGTRPVQERST